MAKTKVHGEYLDPSVISGQTQVTAVGADSVLILDATDNALKKALLSDVIETVGSTPSFTSATISGDLTVDTSTLKVDSSNNRVGVGTASPAFTLDVQDTSDPAQIRLKEDGNTNGFIFKNFNGNEAQLVNVDNGPMVFKTNDTERTRIGNTGKASWSAGGIGAVSTQDRDFTFYTEGSTNGIDIRSNDYRNILLGAGGSSGAAMDAGYIGIYKDGSTKIALNANGVSYFDGGNFGIANSSPGAVLHVGGDGITVNGTLDISRTAIFRTEGTGNYSTSSNASAAHAATFMRGTNAATGDQVGHSYVFDNGDWSATAEIMAEVEDSSTAYSRLNFKTWRGGMATRQVITSEGYVQKAYQPYIRCAGNNASMASNQGTTQNPFNNWAVQISRGITHSNGEFTCPIAGEYLITYSFYNWMNNTGKGVTHAAYLKKGNTIMQETNNEFDMGDNSYSYYDNNLSNSLILNMAAGDTFKFEVYADIYGGTTHTNMSAYLLG